MSDSFLSLLRFNWHKTLKERGKNQT